MDNTSAARTQLATSQFERIAFARQTILDESNAVGRLAQNLPSTFSDAVDAILECRGAVIVIGIGKAGWIGQKLSATFASTGTRSHFLHPSEAVHGDLGRIADQDLVLLLSNSGETEEVNQLLPPLKRAANVTIAICAHAESTLARSVDCALDYGRVDEACPLGLAPTTSTMVMMAMGDALALVVSRNRGFTSEDFGRYHPGGSLGRKLANVEELMRPIHVCRVAQDHQCVREIYTQFAGPERRSGAIILVNSRQRLSGIFTDSDLARLIERKKDSAFDQPIGEVMTVDPITAVSGTSAREAVELMAERNLSELPILDDDGCPIGMIDVTDVISLLPAD